jgi:hypothetical protein
VEEDSSRLEDRRRDEHTCSRAKVTKHGCEAMSARS